jgi:hypothetical protein
MIRALVTCHVNARDTMMASCNRLLSVFSMIGVLSLACVAVAQTPSVPQASTSSAQSEAAGATTGLGTSHRFKTLAAAADHCPDDTIVWSSGAGASYHLPGSQFYGKAGQGFYACKAEADGAGFSNAGN